MTSKSLKTNTAIFAALSLLQPLPAMTQSTLTGEGTIAGQVLGFDSNDPRTFEEICADAMILDALACELHIKELQAEAEVEAQAAADAAAQIQLESEAAAQAAAEAEASAQVEAAAVAEELAQAATEAETQAMEAAEIADWLAAEAEAAARAAADAEMQAEVEAAAEAAAEADAAADAAAQAEFEADAAAQAEAEAEAAEQEAAADDAAEQAEADADAAAEAESDAEAAAEAESDAAAAAEADAAAQAAFEADAAAQAEAEQDEDPATEAASDTPQATATDAEDCPAEIVDADGTIRCVDELTGGAIDAIAAEEGVEAETEAEVTTETVTEDTHRSSDEEFGETTSEAGAEAEATTEADADGAAMEQRDTGMSDLEKAGLFVLGAVVVGAILANGQKVEANTGDRVIVLDDDGSYRVLKDDDALLRQPGSEVRTERFSDGSIRTTVTRDDGTQIITIRDSSGRALRRVRIEPDGREYLLIDDTRNFDPVIVRDLPQPDYDAIDYRAETDRESLRLALRVADQRDFGRSFSLRQVRNIVEVRELAPVINLEAITFATNSAVVQPSQAEQLRQMGELMREFILDDPTELFLIEGHTDAVGDRGYNLLLWMPLGLQGISDLLDM
jgi:flagellar motor protein MotB